MTREIPWEPVLQVIGTVAEIDDPGRFGLEVLNALSSAIPFDIGSFNEIDLDSGRAVFVASPPEEEDADQETRAAFPAWCSRTQFSSIRIGPATAAPIAYPISCQPRHSMVLSSTSGCTSLEAWNSR